MEENSWNNFVIGRNHSEHHWMGDVDATNIGKWTGRIDLGDIAWTWGYQHGNVNTFFQKI